MRKINRSTSDHSDVESQNELEYNPTPKLWHEIEERKQGRDQYGRKIYDGRSLISQFDDDENDRK